MLNYHLVNVNKKRWNITMFHGKIHWKTTISIYFKGNVPKLMSAIARGYLQLGVWIIRDPCFKKSGFTEIHPSRIGCSSFGVRLCEDTSCYKCTCHLVLHGACMGLMPKCVCCGFPQYHGHRKSGCRN